MKYFIPTCLLICILSFFSTTKALSQILEWEDVEMVSLDDELPLYALHMLGGEYEKALDRLEVTVPQVDQAYGSNSTIFLNVLYDQLQCYLKVGQQDQVRQIRKQLQKTAYRLEEDSLFQHLMYKSWLDAQLSVSMISGVYSQDIMQTSDDPLVRKLGGAMPIDQQAYMRKIAAGMEAMEEKGMSEETSDDNENATEMYRAMFGEEGAKDLAELMKLAEQGEGMDNSQALEMLSQMSGNSLISEYQSLINSLQSLDDNSSAEEINSVLQEEKTVEREEIKNSLRNMSTPKGYQHKEVISNEELNNKIAHFDQLSDEEKKVLEIQLLEKLAQRDQLRGKLKITTHGVFYVQLAQFYEAKGDYQKAAEFIDAYKQSVIEYWTILKSDMAPIVEDDVDEEDKESLEFQFINSSTNQIYINSAIQHTFIMRHHQDLPSLAGFSYNSVLEDKGLFLEKMRNIRASAQASGNDYLLKIYDLWIKDKAALAQYTQQDQKNKNLNRRIFLLERELDRNTNELLKVNWKAVQAELQEGEAAIEFISFIKMEEVADLSGGMQSESDFHKIYNYQQYAALVLLPGEKYPYFVPLCDQSVLDSLLKGSSSKEIAASLYQSRGASITNIDYGQALYETVWQPMEPLLDNARAIYFAPAGSLHQVAFSAIPYKEGLLMDSYDLRQLSSTRNLLYRLENTYTKPKSALLFGGIRYDAKPPGYVYEPARESQRKIYDWIAKYPSLTQYLEKTKSEVENIATLFDNHDVLYQTYTGEVAREDSLKFLTSPSVLHIATHGFFSDTLAQGGYITPEKAMLQSGLLFAGVSNAIDNKEAPKGAEDGVLLANEAAQLNLHNTDLVVLSACETSLGDIQGSEGVYGLQRAIREAGAQNMIMSLWDVPDVETQEMMNLFYRLWLTESLSIPQAFYKAQQQMRQQYDDPIKWAAFVLVE